MLVATSLISTLLLPAAVNQETPVGTGSPSDTPPAVQGTLRLFSGGLDALLSDPRDAGLKRALRMADARLVELQDEFSQLRLPPGGVELLLELLGSPLELAVDLDSPGTDAGTNSGASPVAFALDVRPSSPNAAANLGERLERLLSVLILDPTNPVQDMPGMRVFETPAGDFRFGTPTGAEELRMRFGELSGDGLNLSRCELPMGVRPALAMTVNLTEVTGAIDAQLAGEPDADSIRSVLTLLGLHAEHAVTLRFAFGHGEDRAHAVVRLDNCAELWLQEGLLSPEPLTQDELRMLPADATVASISKVSPQAFLDGLSLAASGSKGMLDDLQEALGIDIRADILDHLGTTCGSYLSEAGGGGGLASMTAFIAATNEEGLLTTVQRIAAWASEEAVGKVRLREWQHEGARCFTLTFPGLPVPIEPTFSFAQGYLIVSATPSGLMAAVEQATGDGPGLLTAPSVRQSSVASFENITAFSFQDTRARIRGGYGVSSLLFSSLANAVRSPLGDDREPGILMPPYGQLIENAQPRIVVTRIVGSDYVVTAEGDRSLVANVTAMLPDTTLLVLGIGVGATLVVPRILASLGDTKGNRTRADLTTLEAACATFAMKNRGVHPESIESLIRPDANGRRYIQAATEPLDAWGAPYGYVAPGQEQSGPQVFSAGPDGLRGTSDDIGNAAYYAAQRAGHARLPGDDRE